MTRNKEEAQRFWARVDRVLNGTDFNLYDIAEAGGVPYKSILSWRQKHLFPDVETANLIARKLNCSLDSLMGDEVQYSRNPRIKAVADELEREPDKLDAVEILLFGKKVGQSSEISKEVAT